MVRYFLGALALGLNTYVSASPLVSQGFNATTSVQFENSTTTTTILSTSTLYASLSPVSAIAGSVVVSSQGQSAATISPAVSSAPTSPATPFSNVKVAAAAQSTSAASFQTVVVTQTVAGCTLGGSAVGNVAGGSATGTAAGGSVGSSSGSSSGSSAGSSSGSAGAVAASVSGQAPFAVASSSTVSSSYAASTLLPAVHWEYPVDDIRNLAPTNSSILYYSAGGVSDPSIQHLFASLTTDTSHDAVVLDHSSYVASTSCSDSGILVTFTTVEAFNFASQSWSAVASSGLVLVTYTDGCHGDSNEQRTFWLIDSLELLNGTMAINAVVQEELAIQDALQGVDMVWGTYYPPTSNSTSNSSSSGSFASSSASGSSNSSSGASSGSSGTTFGSSTTSGTNSSSSSNSTYNGSSCGAAPASTIDGLPAAGCGDATFDTELDNAIGYLDFSSADYADSVKDFAPDIDFDSEDLTDDETQLSRRGTLSKRGFFWKGPKAIIKAVVKVAVTVATAPVRIAAAAVKSIPVVGNFIAKATEFDPSISGQTDFNFGPDASATSPWGQAAQIYTKTKTSSTNSDNTADITIYCVDCGVKGHVALSGQAKWNLLDGLHALNAAINANIQAGVHIGLVANAIYSDTKSKQLINTPLPGVGVAIPKVFTAGVFVSVDAVSTVTVSAQGQALVGVVMTIPNFQANLNLFDQSGAGKSGVTGLTPTFTKRFEASGKISASLQLGLPIAINVGVEVIPLSIKRTIALIEQPSIYGNLTVAASTSNVEAASTTCNNGIEYFANLQNDVKFDFLGLKTFNLNHYDSPALLQGCKQFPSSSSSVVTSSTISSSSTSTDASATATDASATATDASATASDSSAAATDASGTTSGSSATASDASVTTTDASATATDASAAATATNDASATATDASATATDASATATDSSATATATDTSATATDTSVTATATTSPTTDATDAPVRRELARLSALMPRQDNSTSSGDDLVFEDDSEDTFADDTSDTSDQTDNAVDDDSTDADSAEYQTDASEALDQASAQSGEDGVIFTTVTDYAKTFALAPGDDGNMYAAAIDGTDDGAALFAEYDNVIVGDDGERLLHYYPDEMAVYNASRIRLSYEDQIPKTADVITLSPIDYDSSDSSNPNVYFAVDSKGNTYSLVLCDFSNGADSKVFIVNDQSGIDSLTTNINTRYTVTGAPVTQCYGLALTAGVSTNSTTSATDSSTTSTASSTTSIDSSAAAATSTA